MLKSSFIVAILAAIFLISPQPTEAITVLHTETVHYTTLPSPVATQYLGEFQITYYCACKKCCGPNAKGLTASGIPVIPEVTIAVDPDIIPLHSKVQIQGIGVRIAHDTGRLIKGKKIDIYIPDHSTALTLGRHSADVYLILEEGNQ